MKEIDEKDLPDISGGVWDDNGCIPWREPLSDPRMPATPTPETGGPEI